MFIGNISQTVDQLYLSKITIQILTTNKAFYKQIHFRLTKCINKPCANTERNRFFSSVCFHTLDHVKRQQRRAKSEERRAKRHAYRPKQLKYSARISAVCISRFVLWAIIGYRIASTPGIGWVRKLPAEIIRHQINSN